MIEWLGRPIGPEATKHSASVAPWVAYDVGIMEAGLK